MQRQYQPDSQPASDLINTDVHQEITPLTLVGLCHTDAGVDKSHATHTQTPGEIGAGHQDLQQCKVDQWLHLRGTCCA